MTLLCKMTNTSPCSTSFQRFNFVPSSNLHSLDSKVQVTTDFHRVHLKPEENLENCASVSVEVRSDLNDDVTRSATQRGTKLDSSPGRYRRSARLADAYQGTRERDSLATGSDCSAYLGQGRKTAAERNKGVHYYRVVRIRVASHCLVSGSTREDPLAAATYPLSLVSFFLLFISPLTRPETSRLVIDD